MSRTIFLRPHRQECLCYSKSGRGDSSRFRLPLRPYLDGYRVVRRVENRDLTWLLRGVYMLIL